MPLTDFQKGVARLIAANRTPESHIAGGAVINRGETGLRISDDLDIFHDVHEGARPRPRWSPPAPTPTSGELREAGYSVDWVTARPVSPGRSSAEVVIKSGSIGRRRLGLPLLPRGGPDEDFGYCLHPANLATNKVLALVGRLEIRDFLDILQLDREYLSLGTMIWAACGKDEGYTPALILDLTNRHARYQGERPEGRRTSCTRWISRE